MPTTKIADLPNVASPDDSDVLPIDYNLSSTPATGKVSISTLKSTILGNISRPAVDANHLYVWHMGEGCTTNGTDIVSDKGGVTIARSSGTDTLTTGYGMFKTQHSLFNAGNTFSATLTQFTASLPTSISTSGSVSLEIIASIPSVQISSLNNYSAFCSLQSTVLVADQSRATDYIVMMYRTATVNQGNSTSRNSGNWVDINQTYGGGFENVSFDVPHHYMLTWDPTFSNNTGRVRMYFDGRLVSTVSNATTTGVRTNVLNKIIVNPMTNGCSLADLRISNIERDQSYAIAATRALRML